MTELVKLFLSLNIRPKVRQLEFLLLDLRGLGLNPLQMISLKANLRTRHIPKLRVTSIAIHKNSGGAVIASHCDPQTLRHLHLYDDVFGIAYDSLRHVNSLTLTWLRVPVLDWFDTAFDMKVIRDSFPNLERLVLDTHVTDGCCEEPSKADVCHSTAEDSHVCLHMTKVANDIGSSFSITAKSFNHSCSASRDLPSLGAQKMRLSMICIQVSTNSSQRNTLTI